MKTSIYIALSVIVIILIIWSAASYIFDRSVASPTYTVLEKRAGYEVRRYEPYITAQVEVTGTYTEALNEGFRVLADYIFGNNTKQTSIAMTAPVTESTNESEKLAMTAPVLVQESEPLSMTGPVIEQGDAQSRIISFVMPFDYTMDSLPLPNNDRITLVPQDARTVAVLRFSWYRGDARVAKKKQELLSYVQRDGIVVKNTPEYAGYNAPFTAPWLNRNEVMVEIEYPYAP